MFFLVLAGILLLFALLCYGAHRFYEAREKSTEYVIGAGLFLAIAFVLVGIGVIATGSLWVDQIHDLENARRVERVEAIYRTKAEALTAEFAKHLAIAYPAHEQQIFDKIRPDQVNIYLVKYPELRSSATLSKLVDEINKLQSDVYAQQVAREGYLKDVRVRVRNPWLFTFLLPRD